MLSQTNNNQNSHEVESPKIRANEEFNNYLFPAFSKLQKYFHKVLLWNKLLVFWTKTNYYSTQN